MDPLNYHMRMTPIRAAWLLTCAWCASALISHAPIHLGWYTTSEQQDLLAQRADECSFRVNRIYCIVSSGISFWTPATVMVFAYVKIYREARRQEQRIRELTVSIATTTRVSISRRHSSVKVGGTREVVGQRRTSSSRVVCPMAAGDGLHVYSRRTSVNGPSRRTSVNHHSRRTSDVRVAISCDLARQPYESMNTFCSNDTNHANNVVGRRQSSLESTSDVSACRLVQSSCDLSRIDTTMNAREAVAALRSPYARNRRNHKMMKKHHKAAKTLGEQRTLK